MRELKHRILPEHADLLRVAARWPSSDTPGRDWNLEALDHLPMRFFRPRKGQPIQRIIRRNSRAFCRECGEPIAAGEEAVVFGVDTLGGRDGFGGKLADAYIHSNAALCGRRPD